MVLGLLLMLINVSGSPKNYKKINFKQFDHFHLCYLIYSHVLSQQNIERGETEYFSPK